jgi:hypothetical protein
MMIMIFAEGDGTLMKQNYWNAEFYDDYDFRGRGWYTDETD